MITLKSLLRINSTSCIGFGVLFLLMPTDVTYFLSADAPAPKLLITILGIGLIANGVHLIWASSLEMPTKGLILHFSCGDFIWVLASVILMLFGLWITTTKGIIVTIIVSASVGLLGVLQLVKRHNVTGN